MPRWEGDGKDRLEEAALDLFLETGYDSATVAAIARRAGLTERSFYRHFADKREVLFAGSQTLTEHLVDQVVSAPPAVAASDVLNRALATAHEVFLPREHVRRRMEAILRSPALSERELIKLAQLTDALASALVSRGTTDRRARLLADLGMSAFRIASEDWVLTGRPFAELLAAAMQEQRSLITDTTAGAGAGAGGSGERDASTGRAITP